MNKELAYETVKNIVLKVTGIREENFDGGANLIDDLGIESVMAVDIINAIEKTMNVEFPQDRIADLDCVDSIVNVLLETA